MKQPGIRSVLLPILFAFFGGTLLFYLMRDLRIPGGDTVVVLSKNSRLLWADKLVYYAREPWSHALVRQFYFHVHDITRAYVLYCAFSGGLYLALMAWHCRHPLFWVTMLVSAATWSFVGHIEYYAPEMVTILLFLIVLSRALEPQPRAKPVHVALAFALSYEFHKLTLFFLPALLWVFFTRQEGRWVKRPLAKYQIEGALVIIIAMVLLDVTPGLLFNWNILDGTYMCVNEGLMDLLTPLTPAIARHFEAKSITGMFYVYTFGTPTHMAYFLGFLAAGAPLGLALLARYWRRIRENQAALALATVSLCCVLWILMWQPRGFWKDWDLFCLAGLPINFLGAGLALGHWRGQPEPRASRGQWLAGAAVLALFFAGVSVAAPLINVNPLRPGDMISELKDIPFSEKYETTVPFAALEQKYRVKLDPGKTQAVYVYPYAGILKRIPGIAKVFVVSVDGKGLILSTQPVLSPSPK